MDFFMFKVIVTIILIQKHKTPFDNYIPKGVSESTINK